jgi:hypothetical protein
MDDKTLIAGGIGIAAALVFNFVPTLVAFARRHPERRLIGQLNILSILSFLLWMALIAWAAGGKRNDSVINRFIGQPGQRGRLVAIVATLVGLGVATTAYAVTKNPALLGKSPAAAVAPLRKT